MVLYIILMLPVSGANSLNSICPVSLLISQDLYIVPPNLKNYRKHLFLFLPVTCRTVTALNGLLLLSYQHQRQPEIHIPC